MFLRRENYFKRSKIFRPQNTTATVVTGMLKIDIHFDFINNTIAANSELITFEETKQQKMERSNCLGQNLEVFLFIKIILCKCDYFMSGQPWHYPCIADLECDFTEEPSMDYIGLAIVLGRMPLPHICHIFLWNFVGGVVLVMFLGSCCCAACVWCMQQVISICASIMLFFNSLLFLIYFFF